MKLFHRIAGILITTLLLVIIPGNETNSNEPGLVKMSNPARAYCSGVMGYGYEIVTRADGSQDGVCHLPDGSACSQWDFYSGKCGAEYSWCDQKGYDMVTRRDGKDPYSREYAVCVDGKESKDIGLVSGLTSLEPTASDEIGFFKSTRVDEIGELPSSVLNPQAPTSFDWRSFIGQNWITPVKNQASCGSCWAFAAVGLAEAQHNIMAKNPDLDLNLSEQYLVSDCTSSGDCNGGYTLSAIQYIRDSGIPDEACYPYTATNSFCSGRCSDYASRLIHIPNTYYSFNYTSSDIQNLLSSNGPVAISFFIGSAHGGYFDGSGVYRCTDDAGSGGSYGTNHAVLAIGYDDPGGYYLVKNSWGSSWNGDGYFKLGYDECNVEDSQIGWVRSGLPVIYDHILYMPLMKRTSLP